MKKYIQIILVLFLSMFLTGCSVLSGGSSNSKWNFPSDIRDECYGAKNASKECIESKGTPLPRNPGCTVQKVDGEKKFGDEWGWQYQGFWVLGLYYYDTRTIQVGANPITKGEVSIDTLVHEFGHYWLYSNGSTTRHDPFYNDCFVGWAYSDIYLLGTMDTSIQSQLGEVRKLSKGSRFVLVGTDNSGQKVCMIGIADD